MKKFFLISLAIFMTLSISACKKYPPEIEKVCNDVICSDGCKKSCYLDNDFAGKQAFDTLDLLMPGRIFEMSTRFSPYNDLNDYLMQQPRT